MAQISYDPNKAQQQNTTDVLGGQQGQPQGQPSAQTEIASNASSPAPTYVSDGNPYGKYAPSPSQPTGGTQQSSRKTSGGGASSGQFTNVQSYIDKNKQSGQNLGQAVAGKLQTTSDIARQNLSQVQNKFQQGVQAGGVQNSQAAVTDVQKAAQEAATSQAPTKQYQSREAGMYAPTKQADGSYSPEDQALIESNKARVTYGDGSYKDYATQAEATSAMNQYNASNPGFFTYGEQSPLSVSEDRLSSILNAKYTGPTDLSNISGYGKAYNMYQDTSALQNQALKGGNQGELLKRTFEKPTSQYTQGSQLLDQLLLGQGEANKRLQDTARNLGQSSTGKVLDELKSKVKESVMTSSGKAQETSQIREQSRKALTDIFSGKESEVNARINDVMKDWEKYPEYFRERFQGELAKFDEQKAKNQEYQKLVGGLTSKGFTEQSFNDMYNQFQGNQQLQNVNATDYIQSLNAALGDASRGGIAKNAFQSKYGTVDSQLRDTLSQAGLYKEEAAKPRESVKNRAARENRNRNAYANAVSNYLGTMQGGTNLKKQLNDFSTANVGANFDPNAFNLGLSQLEAEALGVKGGEGLYNLLKEPNGIDNLLKTATADKNKLVSSNEQNQLARLQGIAQLAKDYGVRGSGLENVVNKFTERDLAGTQSATDALDMDNFKRLLQGSERTFRTDAAGSNITGTGYGTGSSRGILGSRGAQAWKTLSQNFGDLIQQSGGYRNIYSDEGVNKDLLRQASQAASGRTTADMQFDDSNVLNTVDDLVGTAKNYTDKLGGDFLKDTFGNTIGAALGLGINTAINNPLGGLQIATNALGGSKAAAQGQADYNAYQNALNSLRQNITNKINQSGVKNQFDVRSNAKQDQKLFELLGLLDQTNL